MFAVLHTFTRKWTFGVQKYNKQSEQAPKKSEHPRIMSRKRAAHKIATPDSCDPVTRKRVDGNLSTNTGVFVIPNYMLPCPHADYGAFVRLRFNPVSDRCRITAHIPSQAGTIRSLPELIRVFPCDMSFRVREWVDATRKAFVHQCRVSTTGPVLPPMRKRANQTACTPPSVFEFLQYNWGLQISTFDPCPADHIGESGLTRDWIVQHPRETVFVNPPFAHS